MAEQRRYDIVGGPSQWELSVSFFENREGHKSEVVFHAEYTGHRNRHHLHVYGLKRGDGSGNNWMFEGRLLTGQNCEGFFSTKTRKGWIRF